MDSVSFTFEELLFMVDALNGVICTPETLAANLWGWVPYGNTEDIEPNELLGKVGALSPENLTDLHQKLQAFWEGQESISNIRKRMQEVGLL